MAPQIARETDDPFNVVLIRRANRRSSNGDRVESRSFPARAEKAFSGSQRRPHAVSTHLDDEEASLQPEAQ